MNAWAFFKAFSKQFVSFASTTVLYSIASFILLLQSHKIKPITQKYKITRY